MFQKNRQASEKQIHDAEMQARREHSVYTEELRNSITSVHSALDALAIYHQDLCGHCGQSELEQHVFPALLKITGGRLDKIWNLGIAIINETILVHGNSLPLYLYSSSLALNF